MKKCIIISDSFKGTLSTFDIINLFKKGANEVFPNCNVIGIPIADGGEGTMEAFSASLLGEKITIDCVDSNNYPIKTTYFISNNTAYMDVASCIYLSTTKIKNPFITTSYGVGLMIKDAIYKGCKKIIIGLGGSSTNDGGTGLLSALGVKFYNSKKEVFIPTGGTLDQITSIDVDELNNLINDIEIVGMCDVTNPLLFENGASRIYGKQKGATEEETKILDEKMKAYHNVVLSSGYKDFSSINGTGAAGGIGYSIITFLKGRLEKGIKVLLDAVDFERKLTDVDVIFTGEGNIDSQTLNGKVIEGIKEVASTHNIPLVVISGGADLDTEKMIGNDIKAIITTTRKPLDFSKLKPYSKDYYLVTIKNTLRLIKLGMELYKPKQ
ncbi:MAG: glycerate kinase [Bacillales bacterium]|nr:glycerate kinase [Bacillales bacterium]